MTNVSRALPFVMVANGAIHEHGIFCGVACGATLRRAEAVFMDGGLRRHDVIVLRGERA